MRPSICPCTSLLFTGPVFAWFPPPCVISSASATPTRLGRHGTALIPDPSARWRLDLTRPEWRDSREPISDGCPCPACREHTRGYLHYLARAGELTAKRLVTLHNLTFMKGLMDGIRAAIEAGELDAYAEDVLSGAAPRGGYFALS